MRKFYWIYGGVSLVLVVLKMLGIVGWWVATSFLWFPLGVLLSVSLIMVLTTDIGNRMRKKAESKVKPSCENCVFGKYKELMKEEQCLGEKNGAEIVDGICSFYSRQR